MNTKHCSRCNGDYPEKFFKIKQGRRVHPTSRRDTMCRGCRQTALDEAKAKDRFRHKARDARRRHAARFAHYSISEKELTEVYGWDLGRMAHEIEHNFKNGCSKCGKRYSEMRNGLGDLTLDIINPNAPPVYGTNTRWICMTCNREKHSTDILEQADIDLGWNLWRKNQEDRVKNGIYYGLPLFAGLMNL